jgi:uncharacterized protein (UPF0332 family)
MGFFYTMSDKMTEEEIEQRIAMQRRKVEYTDNLVEYLIYKIAVERAHKNMYLAERNILLWKMKNHTNSVSSENKRRNSTCLNKE